MGYTVLTLIKICKINNVLLIVVIYIGLHDKSLGTHIIVQRNNKIKMHLKIMSLST